MKALSVLSVVAVLATIFLSGCKDEGTGPSPTPTSGTATVDSRYVNNQASGFSFDQAAIVRFPNSAGLVPDLSVLVQRNDTGAILGVFFARPDSLVPSFRLLRQFTSIDSAHSYFQDLAEIPDTTYLDLALPVRVGQVWAIKTRRNTFAKVHIRQTVAYEDSSNPSAPTPYGEATFDWTYQPNGTRRF
jgi:hypothetical protein